MAYCAHFIPPLLSWFAARRQIPNKIILAEPFSCFWSYSCGRCAHPHGQPCKSESCVGASDTWISSTTALPRRQIPNAGHLIRSNIMNSASVLWSSATQQRRERLAGNILPRMMPLQTDMQRGSKLALSTNTSRRPLGRLRRALMPLMLFCKVSFGGASPYVISGG